MKMIKITFLTLFVFSYISGNDLINAQAKLTAEVTFIANGGYLFKCNSKKILIDALYTSPYPPQIAPPGELIQKMENATAPFDSIDLVCITHDHPDHYNRNSVGRHLENNKKAFLICPNALAGSMKSYANYDLIKERIVQTNIVSGSMAEKEINGIIIRAIGFRHANDNGSVATIDHCGFLINPGNFKILHCGDSWGQSIPELEGFMLQDEKADIAFFHADFFYDGASQQPQKGLAKALQYIDPVNIVLMHNYPEQLNGGQEIIDSLQKFFPNIFYFKNPLEVRSYLKLSTSTGALNTIYPESIRLLQNYPNPFNPTTIIQYHLSVNSNVKLMIYNTAGKEIKTLVDSFQNPGEYSIVWDGTTDSNIPACSGVYFYSLLTDETNLHKKMVLLR